jgi:hypothetical protein
MSRLLSRTSITVDEAVAILLGLSTGPIDYVPSDDVEDNADDAPAFDLREMLEDELEVLAGEYQLAKHEKRPPEFIAEKHAALQRHEAVIEQANLYLCAIQGELNKGEQSVLKWDAASSNVAYTFITLHSFNQWRENSAGEQPVAVLPTESVPPSTEGTEQKVVRDKGIRQQDSILDEIRRQGFEPQALPGYSFGKRGVKSAIRRELKDSPLFKAKTAFKNAWDRLRDDDLIRYAPNPTPYKNMKKDTS